LFLSNSDIQYILVTLLEAPILAFFLAFLIRYFDESLKKPHYTLNDNSNLPIYIFMSVIVAIFMGLTVSAEEIIKDRKILKREAFLNLSWNSYLMSKVLVQFGISAIQAFTFVLVGNGITEIRGMMFEYWLILFSCWAGANMLGLVISDSFKTVVTIYILIPFLVTPQIILSGVMVKFEKLNPNISSPVSIPIFGEFITARWGYEALAVNQFINNKYEQPFYLYEKDMSKAVFKKDYWNVSIRGALDNIISDLDKGVRDNEFKDDLLLVSNEIKKQLALTPEIKFVFTDQLTPEKITPEIATAAINYIETVRKLYVNLYNDASNRKEALKAKLTGENLQNFLKLRDDYYNKSLEEFVKDKNETTKTIVYKGELIQKLDPIFMDSKNKFIRAHFYAPEKQVFGTKVGTFLVNVIVLWVITFILYLALYFRVLKKTLDSGEHIFGKKKKGSD